MKFNALLFGFITLITLTGSASADINDDSRVLEQYVAKLDKINYLPSLLPVIMENSDVIELTDEQVAALQTWRETNREDVITKMNEIIQKRIEIKEAALSPDISSARLIQMQNEAFRLQREVLVYKLSCRDLVINTFNRNNWEGFFMVLAEKEMGVELPEMYLSQQ
jgi:hypothetical protein